MDVCEAVCLSASLSRSLKSSVRILAGLGIGRHDFRKGKHNLKMECMSKFVEIERLTKNLSEWIQRDDTVIVVSRNCLFAVFLFSK